MGIYRLKLVPAYIQDKLQREQAEQFQIDELLDECGLIRVRMYSRFRNVTKYQLWVAYIEEDFNRQENEDFANEEPIEPILGYLGYARHQPQRIKYPTTALLENVIDAGYRH